MVTVGDVTKEYAISVYESVKLSLAEGERYVAHAVWSKEKREMCLAWIAYSPKII
jgi:hypothetical protein